MKKILLLIILYGSFPNAFAQQKYWQQKLSYNISVSLNDSSHTLNGYEIIDYQNNSPDTLHFIWMQLWPNAYKNDHTAFSDQLLKLGRTDFYFASEDKRGYINRLAFKADKIPAVVEDHPMHQDIIKVVLPSPLAPGKSVKIETPFHEKLPYNFSRGGHIDQSYQITQWYPRPAVYDKNGWHEMPYLDQGEFYGEFATFKVEINLPAGYVVAATGKLDNEILESGNKIWNFSQDSVHDFAWFADKNFILNQDTLQVKDKIINVKAYHFNDKKGIWKNSLSTIKNTIKTRSAWLGSYPYSEVSIVENAAPVYGGMEYPTIALVNANGSEADLQTVIEHETGHNWFYGILASNERDYPWMDEGMNTFYDRRFEQLFLTQREENNFGMTKSFFKKRFSGHPEELVLQNQIKIKKDQPILTASEKFSPLNYTVIAYEKAAEWMMLLENTLGQNLFDSVMRTYYERWKFKHPSPQDFKMVAEEVAGKNLNEIFALQNKKGPLVKQAEKQIKFTAFFSAKETNRYQYISLAPAAGINYYDKLMLGAVLHNYNLPPAAVQFVAVPLIATATKKLNGIGNISFSSYTGSNGARLKFAIAFAKFTGGSFKDSAGKKNPLQFSKIVPSVQYSFSKKDPLSSLNFAIKFKTLIVRETEISFSRDPVSGKEKINYPGKDRYLNHLQFSVINKRVLYPYNAVVEVQQGDGFVRSAFTGNYFFNYSSSGGLDVRIFAGKFFYTVDKTFSNQFRTDRYQFNFTGPKGYEDYNYDNYFIGRSEFEGISSQQIMKRDGFFKVRTDLLSSKIGKTDNWLGAVNFTSAVPDNINPLSVLPFKLPIKLFADIGTFAEAWKKENSNGRFLYDAGLQLSLFKNVVNVYVPVLYSKVYRDYFKSTVTEKRFLKNISFSIDLQNIRAATLFPAINF